MTRQDGFTLLEVLIAFCVLSLGLSALAQLSALAIRAADDARRMSVASVAADEKLEWLRALSWGYDDLGMPVQDAALAESPDDSLARNVEGQFEYLDAAGRVLNAGEEEEDGSAVFVRRWSIQPLAAQPSTSVVIEVLVVPTVRGADPSPSLARRQGATRLAVRTRRSLAATP